MNTPDNVIADMADAILQSEAAALDDCREREDFMGLYADIRKELKQKAPGMENIIYSYAFILQKELDMCSPRMAYEAGAVLGCNPEGNDGDPLRAFSRYMCRIGLDPAAQWIQHEVRLKYNELIGMLGDTYHLIDDFTDLYRKCNGIISRRLFDFFSLGYNVTCISGRVTP